MVAKKVILAVCVSLLISSNIFAEEPPELPFIDVDVVEDRSKKNKAKEPVKSRVDGIIKGIPKYLDFKKNKFDVDSDVSSESLITIRPRQGKTESIKIAKGILNRILTPYPEPKLLTVDNVETRIDGSVVYVASDSDAPINLFISDTESGNAVSLQLLPTELAMPVEVKIEQVNNDISSSKTDTVVHQDYPYVTEIKNIMKAMALQQIPQGFTLEAVTGEVNSVCHETGLSFSVGQVLSGQDLKIIVLIAINNGLSNKLFEEAYCANEGVIAVSAWPKVSLGPGEKTEIYVLTHLLHGKNGEEFRPSLLK